MDGQTGKTSSKQDISGFQPAAWPPQTWWMSVLDKIKGNEPEYTSVTGRLTIPDSISPAALLVSYTGKSPGKKPDSNRVRQALLSADHLAYCISASCNMRRILRYCTGAVGCRRVIFSIEIERWHDLRVYAAFVPSVN